MLLSFLGGVVLLLFLHRRTQARKKAELLAMPSGALDVACPNCGAPAQLTVGDVVDLCAHCRAPLMPNATQTAEATRSARLGAKLAAMRDYRADRALYLRAVPSADATEPPFELLLDRVGGSVGRAPADLVDWLNRYWAEEYPREWLAQCATRMWVLSVNPYGFPCLVEWHAPILLQLPAPTT